MRAFIVSELLRHLQIQRAVSTPVRLATIAEGIAPSPKKSYPIRMNDPEWAWPAWKFGLKTDDQFKGLHNTYNTFPSSIQDPQAFHHDLLELSLIATTREELYKELASRRQKRLLELNGSLGSLSDEIVANPTLMGDAHWHHAIQLFRTGSLDSLVSYFTSYLAENDSSATAKIKHMDNTDSVGTVRE